MFKIVSINGIEIPSLRKIGLTKNDFAGILHAGSNNHKRVNGLEFNDLGNKINQEKAPVKDNNGALEKLKEIFAAQKAINDVIKIIDWVWGASIKQGCQKNSIGIVINKCLESVRVYLKKNNKKKARFFYVDKQGSERQFFIRQLNEVVGYETSRQYFKQSPSDLGSFVITKPVFTIIEGRYDVQFRVLESAQDADHCKR